MKMLLGLVFVFTGDNAIIVVVYGNYNCGLISAAETIPAKSHV